MPGKPEVVCRQEDFLMTHNAAQDAFFAEIDCLNARPDGDLSFLARQFGKVANRQVSQNLPPGSQRRRRSASGAAANMVGGSWANRKSVCFSVEK
jgi:hypothetical protein